MEPPSTVISSSSERKKNLGNCFLLSSRPLLMFPLNTSSSTQSELRFSYLSSTRHESLTVGFFVVSVMILTYLLFKSSNPAPPSRESLKPLMANAFERSFHFSWAETHSWVTLPILDKVFFQ